MLGARFLLSAFLTGDNNALALLLISIIMQGGNNVHESRRMIRLTLLTTIHKSGSDQSILVTCHESSGGLYQSPRDFLKTRTFLLRASKASFTVIIMYYKAYH